MSTRILVTGGSGFIGGFLARSLHDSGHRLVNLDLREPADRSPFERVIVGDMRDKAAVTAAAGGCSAVFNLAAAHHDYGLERETYFSVNRDGAGTVCEVMAELGINDLVFYSTVAVYGAAPPPVSERTAPAPNSWYGESKLAGEKRCRQWAGADAARRLLVVRPTVVFGPGNHANMYSLIRQIARRRFLRVGAGTNTKSICYVENLVAATLHLWRRQLPEQCFNYIDKPDLTSARIVDAICAALDVPVPTMSLPLPLALLAAKPFDWLSALSGRNLPISTARIRKFADSETVYEADDVRLAGFAPAVPLVEGLRRMCEWYQRTGAALAVAPSLPPARPLTGFRELDAAASA